jgi:hypothetical protein
MLKPFLIPGPDVFIHIQIKIDWPENNGPRIIPERRLIRRGRRKHIRLPIVMDEIEGRQVKRGSRLASNNNNSDNILVSK